MNEQIIKHFVSLTRDFTIFGVGELVLSLVCVLVDYYIIYLYEHKKLIDKPKEELNKSTHRVFRLAILCFVLGVFFCSLNILGYVIDPTII